MLQETGVSERSMMRWMCNAAVRDNPVGEELRSRHGIESVNEVMKTRKLYWYGPVEEKDENG